MIQGIKINCIHSRDNSPRNSVYTELLKSTIPINKKKKQKKNVKPQKILKALLNCW